MKLTLIILALLLITPQISAASLFGISINEQFEEPQLLDISLNYENLGDTSAVIVEILKAILRIEVAIVHHSGGHRDYYDI